MSPAGHLRDRLALRGWPIAKVSRGHIAYIFCVDLAVLVWAVVAVIHTHFGLKPVGVLVLVTVLALAFEEGASRAARLRLRLSLDLKRDMVSVWAVAGAIALPSGCAVLLLAFVLIYIWFRQQRPAGQPLHRKWFNGSTELLGCLGAGVVVRAEIHLWDWLPRAASGAVVVLVAMAVYSVINRALVTVALVWVGARGSALLGSRHDNMVELATLCLGGLVSLAMVYQPWLVALALVPMISLQRGAMVSELEEAATIDAKTGLLNAIALEHVGEREVARAEREKTPLALLIVDIDRFKLVNDTFGHLVGDTVLRAVGKVLTDGIREYDSVGRFGGEEFVAVLPSAGEADALVVAERLRANLERLRLSDLDNSVPAGDTSTISVSIGVACMPADGDSMSALLFAADTALYTAKNTGRNRVVLADRGSGGSHVPVSAA